MYYYISGRVVSRRNGFVVIDNGGVGYKLYTSEKTRGALSDGAETVLYTYLHVREDVFDLYGFATNDERDMFLELLSVSGVGPKAALAILSVLTANEVALAVVMQNPKGLTKAAGVGAKMAQRIILELKDKVKNEQLIPAEYTEELAVNDSLGEAMSALTALGYSQTEASSALAKSDASLSTEELVKQALTKLMR